MAIAAREPHERTRPEDGAAEATLGALDTLLARMERRDFAVRLWNGITLPPSPGQRARFTVVLSHPAALRRVLWPPGELTIGEAFIRGDVDVEGDLVAAFSLRDRLSPGPRDLLRLLPYLPALLARGPAPAPVDRAALAGARHTRARDERAVRHHYDLGNDFYALFLDRRMVYSCAFFPEPDTSLEAAQEAKLELVCRKLRLAKGERLLDVGCGWGALLVHAAERHGVQAVGITLSPPQAELARERIRAAGLEGRCTVEVADYRDFQAEPFDKIVSVGMVEHVGVGKLPDYFRHAHRLLRPGGAFLNHGIAPVVPRDTSLANRLRRQGKFVQRYVFPDGELPFLDETVAGARAAGLELRDVESLREHYALTLRQWLSRLERRREEAIELVGEERYRIWRLYLAGAVHDFGRAQNTVFQSLYVRPDHGRSGLPLSRADWYAAPLLRKVARKVGSAARRGAAKRRR